VAAPVYERAVGIANRETGAPMSTRTKLQIASMTKLFTQIAIRQLEQAGKLSLLDTVGKFLPGYHNATVRSHVTIDQLLRHRSGIGSFWNQRYMSHLRNIRTVDDYLALFQDDSLLFPPGTSEAYSNGGYVVLGAIIERVSGQSYHEYLREHVFGPAGMMETMPFDARSPASDAAIGYTLMEFGGQATGDSRLAGAGPRPGQRLRIIGADGKEMSPEDARAAVAQRSRGGATRHSNLAGQPSMSGPAGDHYSTVGDLLKLAHALVSHTLLDSARSAAVLGSRYAAGGDFRANGGGPGTNAELSIFPSGEVMVVLANYDPPAATAIATFIRSRVTPTTAQR
jgi:CubicO group peptidase (beta-lactamase class C family)